MPRESTLVNTRTMTDPEVLREEIRQLILKHARGDIRDKPYQKKMAEKTVDLFRAEVEKRLIKDEKICHEHHVIMAHFKLTQSVLREPAQWAFSYFATNKSLIIQKALLIPGRPVSCDESDNASFERIPYSSIIELKAVRIIRKSEAVAGLIIFLFGLLFYNLLSITGPFMIGLGILGVIHALILPGRVIEVRLSGNRNHEPVQIYACAKKSGRRIVKFLRQGIN